MANPDVTVFVSYARAAQHVDGLEENQIFRLDRPGVCEPKAFADCEGSRCDEFALELFRRVEARLARLLAAQRDRVR